MSKRIVPGELPAAIGTLYPPPWHVPCLARERTKLGDAAGLTQFGVNLLRLPPGAWSSQRHWHTRSDEFIYVLEGQVVLVTGDGDEVLAPGMAAGFKAGLKDGHCLQNRSDRDCLILEVGTRDPEDVGHFTDADIVAYAGGTPAMYTDRNGVPYESLQRRGPGSAS